MIEEVKKILGNWKNGVIKLQNLGLMKDTGKDIDEVAQQICQLFPPYPDALWSDKEGQCFWCKEFTHWVDICYEGYVCSDKCQQEIAQDVKSRSQLFEPKPNCPHLKTTIIDDKKYCVDCGEEVKDGASSK